MNPTHSLRTLAIIGACAFGFGAPASAQLAEIPVPYYFVGNCEDCADLAGRTGFLVTGVLTLQGYVQGQALSDENFVSFEYSGSNLLDPYRVIPFSFEPSAQATAAAPVEHFFSSLSGSLVLGGPQDVRIEFGDGLGFALYADGSFFTCGVKDGRYYAVDCSPLYNDDFGTGGFFGAPVPEPGTYALMGLGIAALAWRVRRQRAA